MRSRLILLALAPVLLAGGCGGEQHAKAPSACRSAAGHPRPGPQFPADWPWPARTTVTAVEKAPRGGVVVTAFSDTDFEHVLTFQQKDLEAAGYVAVDGEAEHDDAEATWRGKAFQGRWGIRASDECKGGTLMQVFSVRDPGQPTRP